ncbi:hypothetical protein, partial [Ligilactobacillus agilis]|uniref:hypothetical protein n=1 Tax=Ligilactobacillus agilis TaxID=1601 RepID=UPI003F88DBA1
YIINGESSEWAFFNIFSHKELKTLGAKSFTHRVLWRPKKALQLASVAKLQSFFTNLIVSPFH